MPPVFTTIAALRSGAIASDYSDNIDRETTIVQPESASQ